MEGNDYNWKKSRTQQRRKDKRKKDFTNNKHGAAKENIQHSDRSEESTNVRKSDESMEIKNNLIDKSIQSKASTEPEEKPNIDFSNLKRETEEIEKLVKKNQYDISSNWERYTGPVDNEKIPDYAEEPANIFELLQPPSSHGGHLMLKEEQDWAATSKMLLSGCFALDLKLLGEGLACVPFYIRHQLPVNLFSVEEVEQMTNSTTKRREEYWKLVKEEIRTDSYKSVNTVVEDNRNTLPSVTEDLHRKNADPTRIEHLDQCITNKYDNDNKNESIAHMTSHNSGGNTEQNENNKVSLEICLNNQGTPKTNQSSENVTTSFHKLEDSQIKYVPDEIKTKQEFEIRTASSSKLEDSQTKYISDEIKTKQTSEILTAPCNKHDNNETKYEDKTKQASGNAISSSKTSENKYDTARNNTTPEKTVNKLESHEDDLDFLLSLHNPVKKLSTPVSAPRASTGTPYIPVTNVVTGASKIEKEDNLEDWLDSVLND